MEEVVEMLTLGIAAVLIICGIVAGVAYSTVQGHLSNERLGKTCIASGKSWVKSSQGDWECR